MTIIQCTPVITINTKKNHENPKLSDVPSTPKKAVKVVDYLATPPKTDRHQRVHDFLNDEEDDCVVVSEPVAKPRSTPPAGHVYSQAYSMLATSSDCSSLAFLSRDVEMETLRKFLSSRLGLSRAAAGASGAAALVTPKKSVSQSAKLMQLWSGRKQAPTLDINGAAPPVAYLTGPPGIGKSEAVKKVLAEFGINGTSSGQKQGQKEEEGPLEPDERKGEKCEDQDQDEEATDNRTGPRVALVNCASMTFTAQGRIDEASFWHRLCDGLDLPITGTRRHAAKQAFSDAVLRGTRHVLVVLDEMDQLLDLDQLAGASPVSSPRKSLPSPRKTGSPRSSQPATPFEALVQLAYAAVGRITLVGIANTLDLASRRVFQASASPGSAGRTCPPLVVAFEPYSPRQVMEIIKQRLLMVGKNDLALGGASNAADSAGPAFTYASPAPSTAPATPFIPFIESPALELCARRVATHSGDVRLALEAARRAVQRAEQRAGDASALAALTTLTAPRAGMADMLAALKTVGLAVGGAAATTNISALAARIAQLPFNARLALVSIVNCTARQKQKGGASLRLSDVYPVYAQSVAREGTLGAVTCDEFRTLVDAVDAQGLARVAGAGECPGTGMKRRRLAGASPQDRLVELPPGITIETLTLALTKERPEHSLDTPKGVVDEMVRLSADMLQEEQRRLRKLEQIAARKRARVTERASAPSEGWDGDGLEELRSAAPWLGQRVRAANLSP